MMKVENPLRRGDEVGFVQIVDSRNRGDLGDLRILKIVRPPAVNVMVKQGWALSSNEGGATGSGVMQP
jgi:hypothetical protein